ncbi:MAG: phosphate acyltransferase PlsX [Oscillospiraceae bacterium]|jgi:glycerol-3-phosphate acyltransferase PlsX|nr:phosphate acyltransferase PlsX [Oscillospiraceae bacterium]
MRIIIDAMGGDNAPDSIVSGAVKAAESIPGLELILVGRGEAVLESLKKFGHSEVPKNIEIVNASDLITQNDDPTSSIREKKDASMVVALNLLRNGGGDALLSAGNTGALLTGATLIVKRIKGIRRAALAPVLPSSDGARIIIDVGANIECTPEMLLQFAAMGLCYAKGVLAKPNPRCSLLNIGAEEEKGTPLYVETYKLLQASGLNFAGNIEARDFYTSDTDVVVCDGFSGNVLLKSMEGMALYLLSELKSAIYSSALSKLGGLLIQGSLAELKKNMDYNEIGGSVLLGISKPVVKAHGSSNSKAIFSAIKQAVTMTESGLIADITAFAARDAG